MWIHLIDADSKIPNLAIMKLSAFYKAKGVFITMSKGDSFSFSNRLPDKIYISIVFKKNAHMFDGLKNRYPNVVFDMGGSGYDLNKVLPPEIEVMKPDYTLYPECDYSIGFSSRGCIRTTTTCPWCIVPVKEGFFHRTQPPEEWYNPSFSKIVFLDNNILADKEWFFKISNWCLEHKLKIWFTQGLDIRLLDLQVAKQMIKFKNHHMLTFAWDDLKYEKAVRKGIDTLKEAGFTKIMLRANVQFYVYVNSDADYDSGVYRCREIKKLNCNTYLMYNIDNEQTQRITNLKRWSKSKELFWSIDIGEYDNRICMSSGEKAMQVV